MLRVRLPEPGSNGTQGYPGRAYGSPLASFEQLGRLSDNNTRLLEPDRAGSRCASGVFHRRAGVFPGVPGGRLDRRRFLDRHNALPERITRLTRQLAIVVIRVGAGIARMFRETWEEAGSRTRMPDRSEFRLV